MMIAAEPVGIREHKPGVSRPIDQEDATCALIVSRRNVSPKRLVAPGPNEAQLDSLFAAAAAAPDHGLLLPWRFVTSPRHAKRRA